ncbi:hypothetical protein SAMN05421734_101169 [Pelagirhabdus alkalitolerans]|uniref:Uncharacterized protein n=1 Tax=Pelagirhabdus alkalitolerans TaxID=1612202 RepID=A0A1G6GJA8_9BACI|nr:hypothetical protein [Pelagirhabdus alkalitolerans]SDB82078.1 hypothetical protein SAMN05421734_101169 [Pelagirhabdus alkalitolerans]
MRKGLIVLFLLLVLAFGVIGFVQDNPDQGVIVDDQQTSTNVSY